MKQVFKFSLRNIFFKTVLSICAIASVSTTHSQTLHAGVRAGYVLSNWTVGGETTTSAQFVKHPEVGVFAELDLAQHIGLETGVTYSTMGTVLKYDNTTKQTVRLNYVQVPLLAHYRFSDGFSVFAGHKSAYY
jgi:hypothetical protein